MTRLILALLAVQQWLAGQMPDGIATAEVRSTFAVAADRAVFDISVPLTDSLDKTIEKYRDAGLKLDEFEGFDGQSLRFSRTAPAGSYEDQIALLSRMRMDFRLSRSASAAALERIRTAAWPSLYARARRQAEALLREAGYRPGDVVSVTERHTPLIGQVEVTLAVTVRAALPERMEPLLSVFVQDTMPVPVSDRLQATIQIITIGPPKTGGEIIALLKEQGFPSRDLAVSSFSSGPRASANYELRATLSKEDLLPAALAVQRAQRTGSLSVARQPAPADPTLVVSDARRQADSLARVLGLRAGPLRSLRPVKPVAGSVMLGIRTGDFSNVIPAERVMPTVVISPTLIAPSTSAPSIQATFALVPTDPGTRD